MRRLLLAVLATVAALPGGTAAAQTPALPGDCVVDENAVVQVLLLIDQSGSLARTDPDDQRLTGARAVVRSYASLADRVSQVEIQVAGFGQDYRPGEWIMLDQDSLDTALGQVDAVGCQPSDDCSAEQAASCVRLHDVAGSGAWKQVAAGVFVDQGVLRQLGEGFGNTSR